MSSSRLNTFLNQPFQSITFYKFLYVERWKYITTAARLLIWPCFGLSACLLMEGFIDKKCFKNRAFTIRLESIPLHFTYPQECWLSKSSPFAGWPMLIKATNLSLLTGASLQNQTHAPHSPLSWTRNRALHEVSGKVACTVPRMSEVIKETRLLPYALLLDLGSKREIQSNSQIIINCTDFLRHLGLAYALTPPKGGGCYTHTRTQFC